MTTKQPKDCRGCDWYNEKFVNGKITGWCLVRHEIVNPTRGEKCLRWLKRLHPAQMVLNIFPRAEQPEKKKLKEATYAERQFGVIR